MTLRVHGYPVNPQAQPRINIDENTPVYKLTKTVNVGEEVRRCVAQIITLNNSQQLNFEDISSTWTKLNVDGTVELTGSYSGIGGAVGGDVHQVSHQSGRCIYLILNHGIEKPSFATRVSKINF